MRLATENGAQIGEDEDQLQMNADARRCFVLVVAASAEKARYAGYVGCHLWLLRACTLLPSPPVATCRSTSRMTYPDAAHCARACGILGSRQCLYVSVSALQWTDLVTRRNLISHIARCEPRRLRTHEEYLPARADRCHFGGMRRTFGLTRAMTTGAYARDGIVAPHNNA